MPRIVADRWSPCPAGELDRLEATLHAGRSRHTLATIVLVVITGLALAGAAYAVAKAIWPGPSSSGACETTPCAPVNP